MALGTGRSSQSPEGGLPIAVVQEALAAERARQHRVDDLVNGHMAHAFGGDILEAGVRAKVMLAVHDLAEKVDTKALILLKRRGLTSIQDAPKLLFLYEEHAHGNAHLAISTLENDVMWSNFCDAWDRHTYWLATQAQKPHR